MLSRCEKLLEKTGCPVLITSDENCFYYSGFTGGDSFLLIAENFRGLYTDGRYTVQAKMEAPDFEIIDSDVMETLKKTAADLGIQEVGIEERHMTVANMARFTSFLKFLPMGNVIDGQRRVKDLNEIECIAKAESLAEAAFSYFVDHAHVGMSELECAELLESYMRKNGARKPSFETIVATGERGAMPHARAGRTLIRSGEAVVLDFGCVLDNYSSDMTRTVFFGKPDKKAEEIYTIVKEANLACCDKVRAGMTAGELDRIARDIIERAGYGKEFCHSLGHGVGLKVHEAPYARRGSGEVLEAGMSVTIEPGIYLPGEFGIRIEDLVIIENSGCRNLNSVTKEPIIIQ